MATNLYTLKQAAKELAHVYPTLKFTHEEDLELLIYCLVGQFFITVEKENSNQFTASVVASDINDEDVDTEEVSLVFLSKFTCRSAPIAVNQVLRKFYKYHSVLYKQLNFVDKYTFNRKLDVEQPPIISDVHRLAIARTEEESGEQFTGTTAKEAEEFIHGIKS